MKTYTGACHCGAISFEVETDLSHVIACNCSHCEKNGLVLNFVDKEKFKLLSGKDALTEYFFGDKTIRYLFCHTCGTHPFAEGVTFPQTAINVRCLDGIDLAMLTITPYNGKDL
ncbi:MAG: aldehyde-activating protein [Candidatus Yonathbacteria bacterium RIFOXYC1_FULL_52_10]|uniref:Aldehyde-activating protein n=1 Tax=Candidatus Yonathbacteria bacterium RIFOXYD1_FULL_52_36 TaxID=1802730 RepID=A0A1G2SMQ7_9BACT|nr:MAG: aldehyde-activating protein [Candidatus Yonathbacteria bacterium RIFOXYC1_FULL_52_10]OHA86370.1 MAG: aldehyde-activating protein [Candidatus Yonathbacteria bacterium RIFOXYD1_FULL_52_36]